MSLFSGDSSGFGAGDVLGTVGALAGLYGLYDASKGGGSNTGSQTVRQEPAPRTEDGQTIWNSFMESLLGTNNWQTAQQAKAAGASPSGSVLANLTSTLNGGSSGRGGTIGGGSGDIGGYESSLGDRSFSLDSLGSLRGPLNTARNAGASLLEASLPNLLTAGKIYGYKTSIQDMNASLDEIAAAGNVGALGNSPYDIYGGYAVNTGGGRGTGDRARDLDRASGGMGAASGYGGPGRGGGGGSWA